MKKLLLLVPVLALMAGCTSTDRTQFAATAVHLVARRGTIEAIKYKPEWRDSFVATKAALDAVLALNKPTADDLTAALQQLKIKEIQGDAGAQLIADVKDLITLVTSPFANLDVSGIRDIVAALDAGVSEGLGLPAPTAALDILRERQNVFLVGSQ